MCYVVLQWQVFSRSEFIVREKVINLHYINFTYETKLIITKYIICGRGCDIFFGQRLSGHYQYSERKIFGMKKYILSSWILYFILSSSSPSLWGVVQVGRSLTPLTLQFWLPVLVLSIFLNRFLPILPLSSTIPNKVIIIIFRIIRRIPLLFFLYSVCKSVLPFLTRY